MFVTKYINRVKSYKLPRFIIESSILSLLGKVAVGILIVCGVLALGGNIHSLPKPNYQERSNILYYFFWLCLAGPAIETIISQWLPITLLRKFTTNATLIICIDTVLFAAAHWWNYGFIKLFTMLPVGLILAWSFWLYYKESFFKAFFTTTAIHALINFMIFLPIIIF